MLQFRSNKGIQVCYVNHNGNKVNAIDPSQYHTIDRAHMRVALNHMNRKHKTNSQRVDALRDYLLRFKIKHFYIKVTPCNITGDRWSVWYDQGNNTDHQCFMADAGTKEGAENWAEHMNAKEQEQATA